MLPVKPSVDDHIDDVLHGHRSLDVADEIEAGSPVAHQTLMDLFEIGGALGRLLAV